MTNESSKTPTAYELEEIRVESLKQKRPYPGRIIEFRTNDVNSAPKKSSGYVYVNPAYSGSASSVNRLPEPPTSVIREQYWTCSRWPFSQRVMAISVGVLLGAVIGLAVTMGLRGSTPTEDIIGGMLGNRAF